MKKYKWLAIFALLPLVFTSCETKEQSGALGGAALGALTGAAIGDTEGAIIGGVLGGVTGAVVGQSLDEQDRRILAAQSPRTLERIESHRQLSLADVKAMARADVSDDIIISQIQSTRSRFVLSTNEIIELRDYGVSDRVIDYIIQTGRR